MYRNKFLKAIFNDKQEMVCPDARACSLSVCLAVPFGVCQLKARRK